jgi:hypothetical protein
MFINDVSGQIHGAIGVEEGQLIAKLRTEYYHGDASETLILRCRPVVSLSSIHIDSSREWEAASEIDLDDVILAKSTGIVRAFNLGSWASGSANIKVRYTAGWVAGPFGTVPYGVKRAAKRALEHAYLDGYIQRRLDHRTESIGDQNTTFAGSELQDDVIAMLEPYRTYLSNEGFSHAD